MNDVQKYVLMAATALVIAMGAFPPWTATTRSKVPYHYGYGPIWSPPEACLRMNVGLLLTQRCGVCIVAGSAWLLLRQESGEGEE